MLSIGYGIYTYMIHRVCVYMHANVCMCVIYIYINTHICVPINAHMCVILSRNIVIQCRVCERVCSARHTHAHPRVAVCLCELVKIRRPHALECIPERVAGGGVCNREGDMGV